MSGATKRTKKAFAGYSDGAPSSTLDSLFSGGSRKRARIARPSDYGTGRGPSLASFDPDAVDIGSSDEEEVKDSDAEDDDEGGRNTRKPTQMQQRGRESMFAVKLQKQGISLYSEESAEQDEGHDGEEFSSEEPLRDETPKQTREREREERRRKIAKMFAQNSEVYESFTSKGLVNSRGEIMQERKEEVVKDAWMDEWEQNAEGGEDSSRFAKVSSSSTSADAESSEPVSETDLLKVLLKHMEDGETVTKTLQRLAGTNAKKQIKKKNVRKKTAVREDTASKGGPKDGAEGNKEHFEEFVSVANQLLAKGKFTIYSDVKAKLAHEVRMAQRRAEEEAKRRAKGPTWEFKWNAKDVIRGVHDSSEMKAWQDAGYFKSPDVLVRLHKAGQGSDEGWVKTTRIVAWDQAPRAGGDEEDEESQQPDATRTSNAGKRVRFAS